MGFWKHIIEDLEEDIVELLPEPWKKKCNSDDEFDLYDVPTKFLCPAMDTAMADYHANQIEITEMRIENR